MAIDIVEAVSLVKSNRQRDRRLLECREELDQRAAEENAALQKEQQALFEEGMVPFCAVFQRLKRVDPVELNPIERPTVGDGTVAGSRLPRKTAVTAAAGALAGGVLLGVVGPLVVGRAARAGSYRAVRAFGSASTGSAIKRLHGAAARNAMDAWFGGGSVAMGGGGTAAGRRVLSRARVLEGPDAGGLVRDGIAVHHHDGGLPAAGAAAPAAGQGEQAGRSPRCRSGAEVSEPAIR